MQRERVTFPLPQMGGQLHIAGPLPLSQGKIGQLHAPDPPPFPKERTETDQLHAEFLGCYID